MKVIIKNVDCRDNDLENLEGLPDKLIGYLICSRCHLKSLRGCPTYIGEYFNCAYNDLLSLEFGPTYVGGYYDVFENDYLFTKEQIKATCEIPRGDNYIYTNYD